jgi:hypothetical protein
METSLVGRLRRRLLMPDRSEVTLEKRGFQASDPARGANIEKVGHRFLDGFEYGIAGRTLADVEGALETVELAFRGFAYEGCGMALAVRDGLSASRPWIRSFLDSRGADHVYMVYVGVGWAMARLPKIRWRAIMPEDTLLRWLALDGYGFHQAYFRTEQYVNAHYQGRVPGWPREYANNAVDQGIGRALWFVNVSDPERVAACIAGFAKERHGDLWSGIGLASAYAGGVDAADLDALVRLAGEYRPQAAQGAAFAAKARLLAGTVTEGTELGVRAHCGMSVAEAAAVTDEARDGLGEDGQLPAYEAWRRRIAARFAGRSGNLGAAAA